MGLINTDDDNDDLAEEGNVDRGYYPKTMVFVRHAESEGNLMTPQERAEFPMGTTYYKLTARGEVQADITGRWLREHYPHPSAILRSYYTRTAMTAERCYPPALGYKINEDERLAEANRGIWHVRSEIWMREHRPEEVERRELEGRYHYRPPGGENSPDIERRIRDFRKSMRRRFAGKIVVVVTHGNWLLHWQKRIHHWTIAEMLERYERSAVVENASVLIYHGVVVDDRGKLVHDPKIDYIIPWHGKICYRVGIQI